MLLWLLRRYYRWRWNRRSRHEDYIPSHAQGPYYGRKYLGP